MKKILVFALTVVLLVSSAGYTRYFAALAETVTMTAPAMNSSSASEGQSASITLTDYLDRIVTLKQKAARIASAYYISTALLVALGSTDQIVGIEAKAGQRPLYQKAAPSLLSLPEIGSGKGLNIEACAQLNPDLVILPVRLKDSIDKLTQLGIPVIAISPETYDDFLATVALIGKAAGQEARANDLLQYYSGKMADISERLKNTAQKPKVYFAGGDNPLTTCTSKMYQHTLVESCGGENATGGLTEAYWAVISAEQLLSFNPDFIFRVNYASFGIEEITGDVRFASISAVKNNKVFTFPSAIEPWDYPTPSSILGMLWLTLKLHPETYTAKEYQQAAMDFYQTFFHITVTAADIGL